MEDLVAGVGAEGGLEGRDYVGGCMDSWWIGCNVYG